MFCYGSGVIDGPRSVPSLVPSLGILGSRRRRSYRPGKEVVGQKLCPVCGVSVQKLERHLNKVHNGLKKTDPSLGAAAISTRRRKQLAVPVLPQTNPSATSAQLTNNAECETHCSPQKPGLARPKPQSEITTAAAVMRDSSNSLDGFTVCSECGVSLLKKHVQRHFKKAHTKRRRTPHAQASGLPKARRTAASTEGLKNEVLQAQLNRAMDATKDYAHSFREHGRYGSHPSHDDYDEGTP
jgi:hypothetical protein